MAGIFDFDAWRQVLVSAFQQLGDNLVAFFPSLVGTIVLLLAGWAVSRVSEAIVRRALQKLGLDRVSARLRLPEMLSRAGVVAPPSRIVGRLLFWIVMMTFVLSAVETLGLSAATSTIDRLIAYLPNVIASGLIVFIGLLLSRFARGVVTSGAMVVDVDRAERLRSAVGGLILLLVAVVALEQLELQTTVLVVLVAVVVGGMTLTLGLAFALGAQPVICHILAGHFLRQRLALGATVEIDGRRGQVENVGSVDTLLKDPERSWSVPNATLLDTVILR